MMPRIGITGLVREVEGRSFAGVNAAYAAAVIAAGGLPVILPPFLPPAAAGPLGDAIDGVLLSGGADIDPARYGAVPHPALGTVEPDRDDFDLAMIHASRARGLPVLAICRGMQAVNVALGGTLWQDLPSERPDGVPHDGEWPRTERVHPVTLTPDSAVARAAGTAGYAVNSFHHQGVRVLAPGLAATGLAPDGLIEAIEAVDGPWLVGVQWHPEAFHGEARAPDHGLFRAFVHAAGSRTTGSARD